MNEAQKKEILDQFLAQKLQNPAWTIRFRTDSMVVLAYKAKVNHILHAVLSLFTFGLWLIPWLFIAGYSPREVWTYEVTGSGEVIRR
jgi:hypothetical protein